MRSCMLRIYFECSKGYERRTAYAARVGIAFHQTLQSLTENPIGSSNPDVIVEQASLRFREELALQETQKSSRPREQMLTCNEERVQRALESVIVEALRLAKYFSGKANCAGTQTTARRCAEQQRNFNASGRKRWVRCGRNPRSIAGWPPGGKNRLCGEASQWGRAV